MERERGLEPPASSLGSRTSFVAKLNPSGSGLAYATYLGGTSLVTYLCCDSAAAVAVDAGGNAYVVGTTYASGFPITPGAVQTRIGTNLASNAYAAKLNSSGTALIYSHSSAGVDRGSSTSARPSLRAMSRPRSRWTARGTHT